MFDLDHMRHILATVKDEPGYFPRDASGNPLPEPCIGCPHRAVCSTGQACESFEFYTHMRTFHRPRSYYMLREREPSRERYERIFNGEDDEE